MRARASTLRDCIRSIPLYFETIEWLYHSSKGDQTKTQVASYWHDHHSGKLDGATGAALTDAVIFFMRVLEQAGLSHFVPAGRGRPESYLQVDNEKLESYLNNGALGSVVPQSGGNRQTVLPQAVPPKTIARPQIDTGISVSPGIHINLEIHIAADAKAATVEEIFKNMRKYILDNPDKPG